jgi:hypothetical protein
LGLTGLVVFASSASAGNLRVDNVTHYRNGPTPKLEAISDSGLHYVLGANHPEYSNLATDFVKKMKRGMISAVSDNPWNLVVQRLGSETRLRIAVHNGWYVVRDTDGDCKADTFIAYVDKKQLVIQKSGDSNSRREISGVMEKKDQLCVMRQTKTIQQR